MKIAYITAGAAGMFCGSCMRDNTLVAALQEQGHDALLIELDEILFERQLLFYTKPEYRLFFLIAQSGELRLHRGHLPPDFG